MEEHRRSGYLFANKFALIMIQALEEVMWKNGLNAILNLVGLSHLTDNYPPGNLAKEFDFANVSAINQALEEMYGPRGGHGLALRAGRETFDDALRNFGALAGVGDLAFKVLPLQAKLHIGLSAMAKIFSQVSDQTTTVEEHENEYVSTIHRCPVCWSRSNLDKPVCYFAVSLLQAGLEWVSESNEFRVYESHCIAMGDSVCGFIIPKTPISL